MASSSTGTTSSGSSIMLRNSGSEENLQALMDQKKRKRMISNRELARRSRLRLGNSGLLTEAESSGACGEDEEDDELEAITVTKERMEMAGNREDSVMVYVHGWNACDDYLKEWMEQVHACMHDRLYAYLCRQDLLFHVGIHFY
ncbi:hypothetical protein KFK09_008413 [Dendrobium nobile]|uniref:Uncharacterized protein n=1 Tax=Dendrobium nobile TaxID=94219 RepID=A0A8T3BPE4_DENNO|nr:hypothetical protein KFK09_008413 [Dendrobium nobile]